MSELRKDPVNNRWVITLDDKGFAPGNSFSVAGDLPQHDNLCPFCRGNESKCGNNIVSVPSGADDWELRVIPNNEPYLKVEIPLKRKGESIFDMISGTGANEVIIESSRHDLDIDTMSIEQVSEIFKTYRSRILDLRNDERLEYVLIFRNRGERAGSAIIHPHSQIMGMPVVPKTVLDEMESSAKYYDQKNRCVFCDIIEDEKMLGKRVVLENDDFICITPFASMSPFELWVLPKSHSSHFRDITDPQSVNLADIMREAVRKLNLTLNRTAYNYMIHSTPIKSETLDHYHWHIEIFPRVKHTAGFEWGSGFHINPTPPEIAAEYLRGIE